MLTNQTVETKQVTSLLKNSYTHISSFGAIVVPPFVVYARLTHTHSGSSAHYPQYPGSLFTVSMTSYFCCLPLLSSSIFPLTHSGSFPPLGFSFSIPTSPLPLSIYLPFCVFVLRIRVHLFLMVHRCKAASPIMFPKRSLIAVKATVCWIHPI